MSQYLMEIGVPNGLELASTTFDKTNSEGLAQLVAQVSHALRLCSGPGFNSCPGSLCCASLALFPVTLFSYTVNKARKAKKNT